MHDVKTDGTSIIMLMHGFVNRRDLNSGSIVQLPTRNYGGLAGMSKTHKSPFRYSRVREDHRLISAALDIQPDQENVCA